MIWSRGEILPDDALLVSVADRTFEHGLGLFETLRTWKGRPVLLPRHLARLQKSALELGLPLDPYSIPTSDDITALLVAEGRVGDALLRITLTGGSGQGASRLWMRSGPLPPDSPTEGVRLGTVGPARRDPLAGYKSLNYWPYRLLHEQARAEGCDEAILIDGEGRPLEGSRTNLFFVTDSGLATPSADGRILPGIMRGLVLERARELGLGADEAALPPLDRGPRPGEIFLTNAVRGIIPVDRWGDDRFPAPGLVTARLREDLLHWLGRGGV